MEEKKKLQRTDSKRCSDKDKPRGRSSTAVKKNMKRGWSDVFDKLTYSDGPGDNIYVYG